MSEELEHMCKNGTKDLQEHIFGIQICTAYDHNTSMETKPPCYVRKNQIFEHPRTGDCYAICNRPREEKQYD